MELLEAQTQPERLQYSESDLKAAAIRAHNAGDIAAARRLVVAARHAASQQSPTVEQTVMSP